MKTLHTIAVILMLSGLIGALNSTGDIVWFWCAMAWLGCLLVWMPGRVEKVGKAEEKEINEHD